MKNKKVFWICIGALDVAVVAFLFVIHIIMLSKVLRMSSPELVEFAKQDGFIPYLAGHLKVYGFAFVIPLYIVLAANIFGLVLYLKKGLKREKITAND